MSQFNQQLIDADVLQAGRISVSALLADPACGARSCTICRGSSCSWNTSYSVLRYFGTQSCGCRGLGL